MTRDRYEHLLTVVEGGIAMPPWRRVYSLGRSGQHGNLGVLDTASLDGERVTE